MRVALAHPTYWPEVRRGAERLVHDLAVGFAAAGDEPTIVTSASRPGRAVEDGVRVLRLPRPPGGARLERRRFEPYVETAPLTYAALRALRPDGVIAFQAPDAAAAARLDAPSVYAHMGIPHRAWLTSRRDRLALVQRAVAGCTHVTALSEHARDAFARWLGVDATVVPPPVDTVRFIPGGERAEHPVVVCAADAREPRKRVALLVDAMATVRASEPRAQLWLDAATAPADVPRAGAPGAIADAVVAVDMTDLPARYRAAWVSALPSWGEAFGLVLAEALACGTPVVGADLHGIPEVTGGDDAIGRRFDGDDPAAVADALLGAFELARDPATVARCRARAETFSVGAAVDRYRALLRHEP